MKSPLLFATVAILFAAAAPAADTWSYDQLNDQADLVIIATPVSVKDLGENTFLPGIQEMGPDGKAMPIPAQGLESNFEIEAKLKGNWPLDRIVLYYLRETSPPAQSAPGGPMLVTFDPKKKVRYLMFLKLDKDGRFVPVTGQTDPGLAIKELGVNP
jgi:hypothetical protein